MTQGINLPFCVEISPTLKIRGLIATKPIRKGQVIESCPAIIFTALRDIEVGEELFIDYDSETDESIDPGYLNFDIAMKA